MDERLGVRIAREQGLAVTGTLGVLVQAARRGMVDIEHSLTDLQATDFRLQSSSPRRGPASSDAINHLMGRELFYREVNLACGKGRPSARRASRGPAQVTYMTQVSLRHESACGTPPFWNQ
jgi:hypothetical protein